MKGVSAGMDCRAVLQDLKLACILLFCRVTFLCFLSSISASLKCYSIFLFNFQFVFKLQMLKVANGFNSYVIVGIKFFPLPVILKQVGI
jgi:hypothetical protein